MGPVAANDGQCPASANLWESPGKFATAPAANPGRDHALMPGIGMGEFPSRDGVARVGKSIGLRSKGPNVLTRAPQLSSRFFIPTVSSSTATLVAGNLPMARAY